MGGREEALGGGRTNTRTHTYSSCYREDGGRCGSGGADLQPAAASLLRAGEFIPRLFDSQRHTDRQQLTAARLLCGVVTVMRGRWIVAARFVVVLFGGWLDIGSFQRKCHTGIQMEGNATYEALCQAEARPMT